nr:immunoglobulin heavy chain junction region [Macaca mulatta]MOY25067.1 immunoglobulin heavy chain junction region [Macaca mulatta]MOY26661.1 immunoglobulin heavy chain junction region [Macaca mulatta]MOY26700.1 immunoglobulin heavy chain junction region [Macaca mulatta]MOY27117.1 immunoglobulin heavy chain junction region [Macaca mulatta]
CAATPTYYYGAGDYRDHAFDFW